MIIMINGAFGVGKTTTAQLLQKKVENSMIYDPEIVGYMLRELLPTEIKGAESPTGDFQDFHLWPMLVVETAKRLIHTYQKHLIVPMTIRKYDYFQTIYNGFKDIEPETFHFCLTASKKTIYNRLIERGEAEGNWCFQQTDYCLDAYDTHNFEAYISTENIDAKKVVEIILNQIKSVGV